MSRSSGSCVENGLDDETFEAFWIIAGVGMGVLLRVRVGLASSQCVGVLVSVLVAHRSRWESFDRNFRVFEVKREGLLRSNVLSHFDFHIFHVWNLHLGCYCL